MFETCFVIIIFMIDSTNMNQKEMIMKIKY
jgi:hypothetical protein